MKTVEDVANGGGPCDRYVSRSGIALASRLRTWRKSLIEPWPRQLDRENSTARRAQEPPTAARSSMLDPGAGGSSALAVRLRRSRAGGVYEDYD